VEVEVLEGKILFSSNPRPHQKTMLLDLSKLFIQSLLGRQNKSC
jgi:hypothetical protein